MKINFDEVTNRKNSNSSKWDIDQRADMLPMWVADMDFKAPAVVIQALEKRVQHGVFGYARFPDAYYEAEVSWWEKRHQCRIQKEWVAFTSGVIPALTAIVQAFTDPGDKVLIQSPVYNNFNTAITNGGCEVVINELKFNGVRYEIDFDDFEQKAADEQVKLFILCNPHNPVGRVWSRDELERLGEICHAHNVIVLADEIHRDLVYEGNRHVPFASISERLLMNSITCTAPSKTFNLAGLKTANIVVANEEFKGKVKRKLAINGAQEPNAFGIDGLIAAYNEGEDWLNQLLVYLQGNRDHFVSFVEQRLPKLKVHVPEATYLMWVDCRALGMTSEELSKKLDEEAGLRIIDGGVYGEAGKGFIRMNIACTRALMSEGLERLERVVNAIS